LPLDPDPDSQYGSGSTTLQQTQIVLDPQHSTAIKYYRKDIHGDLIYINISGSWKNYPLRYIVLRIRDDLIIIYPSDPDYAVKYYR
jgi:hypothetical protein